MYLRGSKWTMTRRAWRRSDPLSVILLIILIGLALHVRYKVVPQIGPVGIPTPTPTVPPKSHAVQAAEFLAQGQMTQAMEAYEKAIDAEPDDPAHYTSLARLQVFNRQYAEAITNTLKALDINPDYALAYAVQGWALGFQEEYNDATLAINKALDKDPNSALAHAYYAEILINQGDYTMIDKAAEQSKKAVELAPNLLEARRARGIVLLNTQNLDEAEEEFKAALAINKNIANLQLYLGVTYKAEQKYDLAQEALLAAYALDPKDEVTLTELSRAFFADGSYTQAAQYAGEAIKLDPANPRLHGNLGVVYYKMEDYEKAIPSLELAVKGGKTKDGVTVEGLPLDYGRVGEYYQFLGFALARSRRCSEAEPIFQALLEGLPDDEIIVFNAEAGIAECHATPTPQPLEETPETSPTTEPLPTPTP